MTDQSLDEVEAAETPVDRPPRKIGRLGRIGLGPKLFLAFAIVAILAVIASGVAWISYDRVESGFERVQEQGVRPLTAALRMARQAEVLAALAPPWLPPGRRKRSTVSVRRSQRPSARCAAIWPPCNRQGWMVT
ncbi:hypothetical protein ACFQ4K_09605 [Tistrella bauzanensis]